APARPPVTFQGLARFAPRSPAPRLARAARRRRHLESSSNQRLPGRVSSPPMPLILVVDDEPAIADAVLYALRSEGMQAEHRALGREVLPRVAQGGVDLVVLDVGLLDGSGFEVCRALRRESEVPVIFLTARDDEIDRVLGLEIGADDYVTKPFSPRELVGRVRARLRRRGGPQVPAVQRIAALGIDREGHRAYVGDRPLELTRYEYALLE